MKNNLIKSLLLVVTVAAILGCSQDRRTTISTDFVKKSDYLYEVGFERYDHLYNAASSANTFEGMTNTLKYVRFTKAHDLGNKWYSEFIDGANSVKNIETTIGLYNYDYEKIAQAKRDIIVQGDRSTNGVLIHLEQQKCDYFVSAPSHTVHNATYNLFRRTFTLYIQEAYLSSLQYSVI